MTGENTLTITDGTTTIGYVVIRGKHRECFDAERRYIASVAANDRTGATWVVRKAWERRQAIEAEAKEREGAE